MIEEELRDTFARHEPDAPPVSVLRSAIETLTAKRRRRRRLARTGGAAALAVFVLFGVPSLLAGPVWNTLETQLPGIVAGSPPDRTLNFLLIGLDPPEVAPGSPRSDTITLVQIPADRRSAYLVSFGRDVRVDIPGVGPDRINSAYPRGGAPLLSAVIQSITGLPIDGTVTVTLDGLRGITDALGGINWCQPVEVASIHTGRTFPVGCYGLDGAAVADLARQRYDLPNGAYDRDRAGQGILVALMRQALASNALSQPGRVADLMRVDGLTINLPGIDPLSLVIALRGLTTDDLVGLSDHRFHPAADGFEEFDPVVAPELFAALRNGTLVDFIAAHPDWVTPH